MSLFIRSALWDSQVALGHDFVCQPTLVAGQSSGTRRWLWAMTLLVGSVLWDSQVALGYDIVCQPTI